MVATNRANLQDAADRPDVRAHLVACETCLPVAAGAMATASVQRRIRPVIIIVAIHSDVTVLVVQILQVAHDLDCNGGVSEREATGVVWRHVELVEQVGAIAIAAM